MMMNSLFPSTNHSSASGLLASDQRDNKTSFGIPSAFSDVDFPSASTALDAYIGNHFGDDVNWKMRVKYEKDLEDLLIQNSLMPSSLSDNSRDNSIQNELQQYLNIRKIVDTSYEQLKRQQPHYRSQTVPKVLSDHLLTSFTSFGATPGKSTLLPTQQFGNHQHKQGIPVHSSSELNQTVTTASGTHNSELSLPGACTAGKKCFDLTHHHPPHHSSVGDIYTGASSSCIDDDVHSGYHSDSSLDFASKNTSLWLSNSEAFSSYRGSSQSAPQSPRRNRASFYKRCQVTADDTLTQLCGSKKKTNTQVPSWVKDLEEGRSPPSYPVTDPSTFASRPNLTQSLDQSSFSFPASPQKQLRFDIDATQMSFKSNTDTPKLSKLSKAPLKMTGILKSTKNVFNAERSSFTTDDIPSSVRRTRWSDWQETERHQGGRNHFRSCSASARLSSTPIKPGTGRSEIDRPCITSVSSVHSDPNTINTMEDDRQRKNTKPDVAKSVHKSESDLPSKYLYRAVEKASSVSQDLGILPVAGSHKRAAPLGINKPREECDVLANSWRSGHEAPSSRDASMMKVKHKDYLRDLVHDIEDRSSSIGTGYTELHEILNADTRTRGNVVTSPSLNYLDTQTVSDSWHRPWPSLPFRRHTSAPDLSSVDSGLTDGDCQHVRGGIVDRFLRECKDINDENNQIFNRSFLNGISYAKAGDVMKSGTMEALKNMLFTMQSITNVDSLLADTQDTKTETRNSHDAMVQTQISTDDAMSPATKDLLESAMEHGGDSLQRALRHLEKLKHMVKGGKDQLR